MTKAPVRRKRRGRPQGTEQNFGREALIEAARDVLRTNPPGRVTRQMVAEHINVDPALIRYYFGDMSRLFTEVLADTHRRTRDDIAKTRGVEPPLERFRVRIEKTLDLFIDNPHHHQLVLETLYSDGKSSEGDEWHRILREALAELQEIEELAHLRKVDLRMLQLTIVAACSFFVTSEPIVKDLFGEKASAKTLKAKYVRFLYEMLLQGLLPR